MITPTMYDFFIWAHIPIFFKNLTILIIGSHIVFIVILDLLNRSLKVSNSPVFLSINYFNFIP